MTFILLLRKISRDNPLHGLDANLDRAGGILGHGHEHTQLFPFLIPHGVEAAAAQIVGQKAIEPTTASLLMSFESVFAAISGWLLLSETFTFTEGIGCILVFGAIMLTQIPVKDKK